MILYRKSQKPRGLSRRGLKQRLKYHSSGGENLTPDVYIFAQNSLLAIFDILQRPTDRQLVTGWAVADIEGLTLVINQEDRLQ